MIDLDAAHGNALLARLSPPTLETLLGSARHTRHELREHISRAGEPIDMVCFPVAGMASMVSSDGSGASVEVAIVGAEGAVGVHAVFHDGDSPFDMMWQLPSGAIEIGISEVRAAMASHPELSHVLASYLASLLVQAAQNGACNRLHDLEQRAAKWLLLTCDRVRGDSFALTQEYFATMLGVTRPKLSLVESTLRRAGYIAKRRQSQLTITDREGLEQLACRCYAIIRRELEPRLTGAAADVPTGTS